jgi:hypothetical protein
MLVLNLGHTGLPLLRFDCKHSIKSKHLKTKTFGQASIFDLTKN